MWLKHCWIILIFVSVVLGSVIISEKEYASLPTLFHFDDFDNCMLYGEDALYCRIHFQIQPKNSENVTKTWKLIQKVSSSTQHYNYSILRHHICVTNRCPHISKEQILSGKKNHVKKLEQCYSNNYNNLELIGEITQITCHTNKSPYNVNKYDYLFGSFMIFIILMNIVASFCDLVNPNCKNQTIFGKYISSFSVFQNWNRLLEVDLQNPDTKMFSSMQGIRFFSAVGVIISHNITFSLMVPVLNPEFIETISSNTAFGRAEEYFSQGTRFLNTEIFFLMSSWLVTYKFCKDFNGKIEVPLSYLYRKIKDRYLRLTPLMAIIILFFATWLPHIDQGPLWDLAIGYDHNQCRQNWWINLLYLNNFMPLSLTCLPQLWSMSADFFFYIFILVILRFIWQKRKRTFLTLGLLLGYHLTATFLMSPSRLGFRRISPEIMYYAAVSKLMNALTFHKASTTNMPGILAGLVFGYMSYQCRNRKIFTKTKHIIGLWIITFFSILGPISFPGFIINFMENEIYARTFYYVFGRTIHSFGFGLFIFGMTQGHFGIIKDFCEWLPFHILGRLTYAAYLVHTIFTRYAIGISRSPLYLSNFTILFNTSAQVSCSFATALFLTLFFEMPFEELRRQASKIKKTIIKKEK